VSSLYGRHDSGLERRLCQEKPHALIESRDQAQPNVGGSWCKSVGEGQGACEERPLSRGSKSCHRLEGIQDSEVHQGAMTTRR
jgi:hypothetical protein